MSFSLSNAALDALLDQIPALAGRSRTLEDLSGGLTNRNVKITTTTAAYVARCADPGNLLHIDRDAEHYNSKAAEQAGVGAPVIDYRPDLGILLIGFLPGVTLDNADFARAGVLAKAAVACRTLHAGPRFANRFDMFERQAGYLRIVQDNGFRLPDGYFDYADSFVMLRDLLTATDQTTVPCNNDLLAANFIEDDEKIWLIDYEYSGNNDPCFELGNIWRECQLSIEQLEELVAEYYGRALRHKLARAQLQGAVAQYGWTLWGCIQNGSSAMEFDFWEWTMERYDNALAVFDGPDFTRLLDDVQATD